MYLLKVKKAEDQRVRKELRQEKRREKKEKKRLKKELRASRGVPVEFSCVYLGSFEVSAAQHNTDVTKQTIAELAAHVTGRGSEGRGQRATLEVKQDGLVVWDKAKKKEAMAHAMSRIVYLAALPNAPLVGIVAKNPGVAQKFCHVFQMSKRRRVRELHKCLKDGFSRLSKLSKGEAAAEGETGGHGEVDEEEDDDEVALIASG